MKKILQLMALSMLSLAVLCGCGSTDDYDYAYDTPYTSDSDYSDLEDVPVEEDYVEADTSYEEEAPVTEDTPVAEEKTAEITSFSQLVTDDVSYVMIYNPYIYSQENTKELNTGEFGKYIEAIINRADAPIVNDAPFVPRSIAENTPELPFVDFDLEGSKSGSIIIPYKENDKKSFYCYDENGARVLKDFTCRIAGKYCNIWTSDNSVSDSTITKYANEFDENIYNQLIDTFGKPRFAENGGKVNLLFTPMQDHFAGCFSPADIFATGEATSEQVDSLMLNLDHAILNINSDYVSIPGAESVMYGTMAHEFQHLICQTIMFYTLDYRTPEVWFNEAMSGYIEEKLYPGTKESGGIFDSFATSDLIRHGQSLYNFGTVSTASQLDIGVYGSVYLFAEYLSKIAGDDIFSNVHNYWRTSYRFNVNEAEAIKKTVPSSVVNSIDSIINFPSDALIGTEDEKWLSKLTLSFYLSLLSYDESDPDAYAKVKAQTLLYDEINPANIEGGGRVIAALKDSQFEVPEDADHGFVYVGLNNKFEVVTDCFFQ